MQDNLIVMPSVRPRPQRKRQEKEKSSLVVAVIALLLSMFALVSSLDLRFSKTTAPTTNCAAK